MIAHRGRDFGFSLGAPPDDEQPFWRTIKAERIFFPAPAGDEKPGKINPKYFFCLALKDLREYGANYSQPTVVYQAATQTVL